MTFLPLFRSSPLSEVNVSMSSVSFWLTQINVTAYIKRDSKAIIFDIKTNESMLEKTLNVAN